MLARRLGGQPGWRSEALCPRTGRRSSGEPAFQTESPGCLRPGVLRCGHCPLVLPAITFLQISDKRTSLIDTTLLRVIFFRPLETKIRRNRPEMPYEPSRVVSGPWVFDKAMILRLSLSTETLRSLPCSSGLSVYRFLKNLVKCPQWLGCFVFCFLWSFCFVLLWRSKFRGVRPPLLLERVLKEDKGGDD